MADAKARAVLTNNHTLSGTFTTEDNVILADTNLVLVTGQTDESDNGLYVVAAGAWTRDNAVAFEGAEVLVLEGTSYAWTTWRLKVTGTITPDVTEQVWELDRWGKAFQYGNGLVLDDGVVSLVDIGSGGTVELPTLTYDSKGRIVIATSGSVGSSYIEGLGLESISNTQLRLDVGAAYIPGIKRVISVNSAITVNQLNATANSLYYAYLYETNGVGQLELSTTAPDVPYFGSARTKAGDDTRRYLGMIRNVSGGQIMGFIGEVWGGPVMYVEYTIPHLQTALIVATETISNLGTVSVGPDATDALDRLVAPGSRRAEMLIVLTTAVSGLYIGWGTTPTPPKHINAPYGDYMDVPLSEGQQFKYDYSGGATFTAYLTGYYVRR